jgi:hypothetical protein
LTNYKVSYEIDGEYDPDWGKHNKFSGSNDGMIHVPVDTSVIGDRIPYRIPHDATVIEFVPDGHFLSRETGTVFRRRNYLGVIVWERFNVLTRDWIAHPAITESNEAEYFDEFMFERLS